jgi:ATP-dependent helicase/nuclease subunit B
MVAVFFDLNSLSEPLARGELILTANNRLRNQMLRAFAAEQRLSVWRPPAIQPLMHWIDEQWNALQDTADPRTALLIGNALQRQILWQDVILSSDTGPALLQAEELAQSADAALRNLQLWRINPTQLEFEENLNTRCFLEWLKVFRQQLALRGLITAESAQEILLETFINGEQPRRKRIYLYGFDDIPPLQRQLLSSACDELIEIPLQAIANARVTRTEAPNNEAEIRAAALWSHEQLQQNPAAVVGIIVPNLGQSRTAVERIFTEVFEPLASLPQTPRYTLPFNFSAGIPLGTTPLIQTALNLLNLNRKQWDLDPLCTLLTSPFFGNAEKELVMRSALDERLRKLGQFRISASDLHYHSQQLCMAFDLTDDESLAARLLTLEHGRRLINGKHHASYWVELFQRQLQQLGWPGKRRLDSQEYQQMILWQKLLEDFCALDGANFELDLSQALKHLRKLAGTTPFQAQTPDSPIQILGALEGAGLQFSHCWIMGLHHRQWPPAPAPNPLLPISLQRQQNMPHASAERELVFARALTENYRGCARHIVVSSAESDGDNELRPSALIRDLPLLHLQEVVNDIHSLTQKNYLNIANAQQLELLHCATGPALGPAKSSDELSLTTDLFPDGVPVRGGSNLFKYQGACPFNAFAQLRLGAKKIEPPVLGFSPMERGTILHNALATLWRTLSDSKTLATISDEALLALVNESISTALQPLQQKRPRELGKFYCQLEHERLARLLMLWLSVEKTRPAFTVVAIEEEQVIQFAGINLRLRMDRVDRLESEDLLVIDYKTGSPKAKSWLGERPDEPQLPLYAVTHPNAVAAIAFAQISAKAMAWIGNGQLNIYHEGIFPPPISWPEQLQEWRELLITLAQDFIAGDARVDFKDQNAQQYAQEFVPLNRILEAGLIEQLLSTQQFPLAGGKR